MTSWKGGSNTRGMVEHYRRVLEEVVERPEARVSEVRMLSEREQQQILKEWNSTAAQYGEEDLCELFERQAELQPERVAVEYGPGRLTYGELNEKANRLGWYLRKKGIGADVVVGICMACGLELVVAMRGVLKAGGAYVPLDPQYPAERRGYMLKDSQAPLVLRAGAGDREEVPGVEVVHLEAAWAEVEQESSANLPRITTPQHLGYVIYTSGSTGKPKGVAIRRSSAVVL